MTPKLRAFLGVSLLLGLVWPARADLPEAQQRGSLRVLAVNDAIFFRLERGTKPGFDREVLQGFCTLHKLELEVVPVNGWDALIPALLAGRGDVIAGGYAVTGARRQQIEFTSEVFPSRKVAFTRQPHRVVTTLQQLRAEKVGTVRGTSMEEAVKAAGVPAANITYVPSGTLPEGLREGRYTAAVLGVEHVILQQLKDPAIQIGVSVGEPASQAFGLRKQDKLLKAALDGYIEKLRRSPAWPQLVIKYLGEAAPNILKKVRE